MQFVRTTLSIDRNCMELSSPLVSVDQLGDVAKDPLDQLHWRGRAEVVTQLGNQVDAIFALLIDGYELLLIWRLRFTLQLLQSRWNT